MKHKLIFFGALLFAGWMILGLGNTYRQVSSERVKTKLSVELAAGTNRLVVAIPKGSYICSFGREPLFISPPTQSTDVKELVPVTTVILHKNRELVRTNSTWIRFRISDDAYAPVELTVVLSADPPYPYYLNCRGTF